MAVALLDSLYSFDLTLSFDFRFLLTALPLITFCDGLLGGLGCGWTA